MGIELNAAPYYDDFDDTKNYYQILYRPGYTVQARELNQMQTITKDQIAQFGNHVFNEGSVVIPGGVSLKNGHAYAKITFSGSTTFDGITSNSKLTVKSATTGLIANLIIITDVDGEDPVTVFIEYMNSGASNEESTFSDNELIEFYSETDEVLTLVGTATVDETGQGVIAIIADGVYYIHGTFVRSDKFIIPVSKYTTDPTKKIGFNVTETIATEDDDESLYSNAIGEKNFKAPGAHRYKIELIPHIMDVSDVESEDFVELISIEDGYLNQIVENSNYNLLGDEFARRTFEESGNYTVDPYNITIQEEFDDGTNDGYSTDGDPDNFVVNIRGGLGYVKGYRVENPGIKNVFVDKARDTQIIQNAATSAFFGNYIVADQIFGVPILNISFEYELYDGVIGNTTDVSGVNKIGTTCVRSVENEPVGNTMNLYIFDTKLSAGKKFSQVQSIRYYNSVTKQFFTARINNGVINNSGLNRMVFELPTEATKTLKPDGYPDTSYTVLKSYTARLSNGIATINVGGLDQVFDSFSTSDYMCSTNHDNSNGAKGLILDITTNNISGVATSSVTLDFSSLGTISGTEYVDIVAPVLKQSPIERTKTPTTNTETLVFTGQSSVDFNYADVYEITAVVADVDVTELFTFDSGMRDSFYDFGKLKTKNGAPYTGAVQVTYNYFTHGAGDYFTVDSYIGFEGTIPSYIGSDGSKYELRDCIDFRPIKTGVSFVNGENGDLIRSNDTIRFDVESYLGRVDTLFVNSDGEYGVNKGIASTDPIAAPLPDDLMAIYQLNVPPYVFNVDDIGRMMIENKRYTMRDIGKLEQRIENLEYYTTLSMLETQTDALQVFDPVTGNSRFKNGFIVDNFRDFIMSDTFHTGYNASIDVNNGRLMPFPTTNGSTLVVDSTSGGTLAESLFSVAYTTKVCHTQPYATGAINVNPYAVYTWKGSMKISPTKDGWVDNIWVAPIIINTSRTITTWGDWASTTSSTTTSTTTSNLKVEVIPWMRSINIKINAVGLKPYTRFYPYFDGKRVDAFCNPATLISNANGTITGTFTVPNNSANKFKTGVTMFELCDNTSYLKDKDHSFTSARFESNGTAVYKRNTITNSTIVREQLRRIPPPPPVPPEPVIPVLPQIRFTWRSRNDQSRGGGDGGGGDPIAQTFMVTEAGGEFVTSIDVYFKTKSTTIPAKMQLRTVETGMPSIDILKFGEKVLQASEIKTSSTGTVATRFTFDCPVYLEERTEYAFVVLSDCEDYEIFYGEMGKPVLHAKTAISKQPTIGVMFSSQNGSTWTEHQNRDVKFTINRAVFKTNTLATMKFACEAPISKPIEFSGIETTNGSGVIKIFMKAHGYTAAIDNVTISGALDGNGISASSINKTHVVHSSVSENYICVDTGDAATSDGFIGGGDVIVSVNFPYTMFYPKVASTVPDNTTIRWSYQTVAQNTRIPSSLKTIDMNEEIHCDVESVVRSTTNSTSSDFTLIGEMMTLADNVSPLIDIDGPTVVFIEPNIDSNTSSDPVCKHFTETIHFDNSSTSASVFVGAMLPGDSRMKLYYKYSESSDSDLNDVEWVELSPKVPIQNDFNAIEHEYNIDDIGSFVSLKFKVEFTTNDKTNIPYLNDFRCIALA